MVARPLLGDYLPSSTTAGQWRMAAWSTYTPAWTTSGSAPTLNNGSLVGAYRREGTTVHLRIQLNVGSTSVVGSGDIRLSVPSGLVFIPTYNQVGPSYWYDASAGIVYRGISLPEPNTSYVTVQEADVGTRSGSAGLGSGDIIGVGGTFEISP